MTLVDSSASGIYHTTAAYHKKVAELLSGVVDDGVLVTLESLSETLSSGGYKDKELVCVGAPELEFQRSSNDPSDVLLVYNFSIDVYVEVQRRLPSGQLPNTLERLYGILDDVLPVLVHSDVYGYQLLIDRAYPVSRSEQTQAQYTIECTIEKQTEYDPCR